MQSIFTISQLSPLGKGQILNKLEFSSPKRCFNCTKFGWKSLSGSPEEDENVKGLIRCWHQQQQSTGMDKFTSVMLIWAFGSGELIQLQSSAQIDRRLGIRLCVI